MPKMNVVTVHHPYTYLTFYDWRTRKWSYVYIENPMWAKLNNAMCQRDRRSLVFYPIDSNTLFSHLLDPEEDRYFTISDYNKPGCSQIKWAPMPSLKVWEASRVSLNCLLYHFGGCYQTSANPDRYVDINCPHVVNTTVTDAIQVFDVGTNEWRISDQRLASPKGYCSSAVFDDGMILVSGGYGVNSMITDECELFFGGDSYLAAPLPSPRCLHSSCVLSYSKVLVTGGYTTNDAGERVVSNTYTIYDAMQNKWSKDQPMPFPMSRHGSILMPNKEVLVFGGSASLSNDTSNVYMVYCYETDTWETGESPDAAAGNTASIVVFHSEVINK